MQHLDKYLNIFLAVLATTQLSSCSKSIRWQEEVPVNTGEVIIMNREDVFVRRSAPGNPFEMGWWINGRYYKFRWQGKNYVYKLKRTSMGPMILYVYPEKNTVSLIDSGWPICSGYAEWRWNAGKWEVQKNINPEIIGRPRNIMDFFSARDGDIPKMVTQEFIRNSRFDLPQNGSSLTHLTTDELATNCAGGK